MRFSSKIAYSFILYTCLLATNIPNAYSSSIRAANIYAQAKNNNTKFLKIIERYKGLIDTTNEYGETAYCIALRYNDSNAASLLKSYGANNKHECTKKVKKAKKTSDGVAKIQRFSTTPPKPKYKNEKNPYLWWGGAAALTATAGVALSGGGGGGSSTNTSVEIAPPLKTTPISADEFKTQEYNNSKYLKNINAADAYSYIYGKDENGNIVGHQSDSTKALETVNVGIIDTGIGINKDLATKVVKKYGINKYNTNSNLWGAVSGEKILYLYKVGNYYYPAFIPSSSGNFAHIDFDKITEEQIEGFIKELNENYNSNFSAKKLELMNGDPVGPGGKLSQEIISEIRKKLGPNTQYFNNLAAAALANEVQHGSHVAGIIASNKNNSGGHGVAFSNAKLYSASWDLEQPALLETVKKMVNDNVKVINNSWGISPKYYNGDTEFEDFLKNPNTQDAIEAIKYAAANNVVWVHATGNDGAEQPSIHLYLGKTLEHSDVEAPIIGVAMLDSSSKSADAPYGKLDSISNWCGAAKDYCLAVEGTDVSSTTSLSTGSINMSGTSMAAPVVTGSIALLKGYYPWLEATNISYLLLETANNTGKEYSNSNKYGKGVLDLNAAVTTPIGPLGLPEAQNLDSISSASNTKLALSSSMQAQLLKSIPQTITAFDKLNRPFEYNTQNIVKTTHASQAALKNAVSKLALGSSKKTITDEKSGYSFSSSYQMDKSGNTHLSDIEVKTSNDKSSTRFYYQENSKYDNIDNMLKSSNNPYLAMNNAYGAENTINLNESSKLKLSLQTGENGLYERDKEQDKYNFDERSYALGLEYSFNSTDYLTTSILGGMLFENDALLGLNGMGAFNINDSSTYYMGLHTSLQVTPNLSLIAAYYRGFTSGSKASMLSISDLQSESFMLASEYKLNKTDKIGLSLSSPLSVVKGNASIMYATGRDNYSNNAYIQKINTSLKSQAKEYDLGLYYNSQKDENLKYQGKISTRFNADGNKGLTDYMGIMGIQYNF